MVSTAKKLAQHCVTAFVIMSEEDVELQKRVKQASGIVAAAEGKVKIIDAMRLVGFSTPERKNMRVYQQVRRRSQRVEVVELKKQAPAAELEVPTVQPPSSDLSTLTASRNSRNASTSETPTSPDMASAEEATTTPCAVRRRLMNSGSVSKKSPDQLPAAKAKRSRRSSRELQRHNAASARQRENDKRAMKTATTLIHRSNQLPNGHDNKRSQKEIVDGLNKSMNANISHKTVSRYVRAGLIGVSPLKHGPSGHLPSRIYNPLKGACVTYLKLEQANSKKQSSVVQLSRIVNATVNKLGFTKSRDDLARKIRKDTAHLFEVGKANVVEQRRLQWTTAYNLDVWFGTWKDTLIDLKFGREATDEEVSAGKGEVILHDGQLERIGNVDETDGSLDDTKHQRGGRPAVTFYAPDVAGGGTAVNKSGYSSTIICGSNAAGEPFPPHFQLKTLAQTEEGHRISVDWFRHSKNVLAKFGFKERKSLPCTFGQNEKAGMNAVELAKYMRGSVLPLYPDIEDKDGKRVIMKVDSGPGRMNLEMLADLRCMGLYLVPGVPNSTSKTQETDQNYGPFKTHYRQNLRALSQARFQRGMTIQVTDLPLLVFGGNCPRTGERLIDAFSDAFSVQSNLNCWKKCGAIPLTRSPMHSSSVRREVPTAAAAAAAAAAGQIEDDGVEALRRLEALNGFHCDCLLAVGCEGKLFRMKAPSRNAHVAVTEPQSKERVQAIKEAKTAGQLFYATGGRHINSNEFFQARALALRDGKVKEMQARKDARRKTCNEQKAAVMMIRSKGDLTSINHKNFNASEVKILLKWKGLVPSHYPRKTDMVEACITTEKPKITKSWTRGEEEALQKLLNQNVAMKETAVGVATTQMAKAVTNNLATLDSPTRSALKTSLQQYYESQLPNVL